MNRILTSPLLWIPFAAGLSALVALGGPAGQGAALALVLIVACASTGKFDLAGLLLGFLLADNLSPLAKRVIFLFGEQPRLVYYGIQAVPSVFLILGCLVAARKLLHRGMPACGWWLGLFLVLSTTVTLYSPAQVAWPVRLAACQQILMPMFAFYVGLALDWREVPRLGRLLAALAFLSVLYGAIQFAFGPTAADRRWAEETFSYSIQGRNVQKALFEGHGFRVFSYYSDHLTWGLLLVCALAFGSVARAARRLSEPAWWLLCVFVLTGCFLTLTRTVWVALICVVGLAWLLRWRPARNAGLLWTVCLAGFPLGAWLAQHIYETYFRQLPLFSDAILQRYLTVGTLEARTRGLALFEQLVRENLLLGQGFGNLSFFTRLSDTVQSSEIHTAHNFVVELAFQSGLLGVTLFFLFLLSWLRFAFRIYAESPDPAVRISVRWLVGLVVGLLMSGYANGSTFLNAYYFLALGFTAGALPMAVTFRMEARAQMLSRRAEFLAKGVRA